MSSLGKRRSRPSAFAISTIFAASVRGRRSSSRTVCIVNVDAPETTRRFVDELANGAHDRGGVDARMAVEPSILGGDKHPSIEQIDAIEGKRQAPLVIAVRKPRRIEPSRARTRTDRSRLRSSAGYGNLSQMPPREEVGDRYCRNQNQPRRLIRPSLSAFAKLSLRHTESLPIAVRPAVSGSYMSSTTSAG